MSIAIASAAKAGKLLVFYMTDTMNPGGHAELWVHCGEWDKYADQLVENTPEVALLERSLILFQVVKATSSKNSNISVNPKI
jgi:hypothetical protein